MAKLKKNIKRSGDMFDLLNNFFYAIGNPEVAKIRYAFEPIDICAYSWPILMDTACGDEKRLSAMKGASELEMNSGDDPFK